MKKLLRTLTTITLASGALAAAAGFALNAGREMDHAAAMALLAGLYGLPIGAAGGALFLFLRWVYSR